MDRANILSGGSFRATFYGAVAFLGVLAVSGIMAIWLIEVGLREDMRTQLATKIDEFQIHYQLGGEDEVLAEAREQSALYAATHGLLLVYDAQGNRLVGHRDVALDFTGWVTRDISGGATGLPPEDYYLTRVSLGDLTLVLGRDFVFLHEFEVVTIQAFLVVAAVMTLVLMALGYWISHQVQTKLDAMGETLHRVAQGETEARLAVSDEGDQIDRIAAVMNTHLDTLSDLMTATKTSAVAIAHDLKRPLARASLGLEAVLNDPTLSDQAVTRIEESRAELARLNGIFESLLRIARIDAAKGQPLRQSFDLGDLAAELGETFEVVAEESGQTLVLDIETGAGVTILGDRGMIAQLIVNLVQNAITHCPPGAFVTLAVRREGAQVVLVVADTGPGIAAADREHVFDVFHRGDTTRTTEGNGLGLALVKSIAERHGAALSLDDNDPGLRVTVRFPGN